VVVVSTDRSRTPRRRAQLESQLGAANPAGFRRSTERKVGDPNEKLVAERDRRQYEEMLRFEEIGFSQAAHSVLVEPLDLSDGWERRVTAMEAEDASTFDIDGRMR
jgi:hypothetical protein